MTFGPESLRIAMRQWASGVSVVSAIQNEVRHGMTVSSFTSVSLNPPTVLISLQKETRTHDFVRDSGFFAVTILSQGQQDISDRFAGRVPEENRFENIETFSMISGAPLLKKGLAFFDCRVTAAHDSATHTVFIGEVLAAESVNKGKPLLYYNRAYHRLQE